MLFQLLAEKFPCCADAARALNVSKQAYSQALKRGSLSARLIVAACALLCIDPAPHLIAAANTLPCRAENAAVNSLYYVNPEPYQTNDEAPCKKIPASQRDGGDEQKNSRPDDDCIKTMTHVNYLPSYEKNRDAIDLIRWVLAVAKLPADSPRFAYYVSRWRVPEKISAAKNDGSFDEAVKNCPPYDPSWVRLVPAAITEYLKFIGDQRASCPQSASEVKFA